MSKYMDFKGGEAIEPEGEALVRSSFGQWGEGCLIFLVPVGGWDWKVILHISPEHRHWIGC